MRCGMEKTAKSGCRSFVVLAARADLRTLIQGRRRRRVKSRMGHRRDDAAQLTILKNAHSPRPSVHLWDGEATKAHTKCTTDNHREWCDKRTRFAETVIFWRFRRGLIVCSVLLYLCRTERMLIICGDKINILPTCHQQTTHILPSPTTYLQIPYRTNADRMRP